MAESSRLAVEKAIPWLLRWKGSKRVVGIPCFLPGCPTVVERHSEGSGRQPQYCTTKHRIRAHNHRQDLLAEIRDIEAKLALPPRQTRGFNRGEARSDLRYLRLCLAAYRVTEN